MVPPYKKQVTIYIYIYIPMVRNMLRSAWVHDFYYSNTIDLLLKLYYLQSLTNLDEDMIYIHVYNHTLLLNLTVIQVNQNLYIDSLHILYRSLQNRTLNLSVVFQPLLTFANYECQLLIFPLLVCGWRKDL